MIQANKIAEELIEKWGISPYEALIIATKIINNEILEEISNTFEEAIKFGSNNFSTIAESLKGIKDGFKQ